MTGYREVAAFSCMQSRFRCFRNRLSCLILLCLFHTFYSMMIKRKFFFVLFVLLCTNISVAQEDDIVITRIGREQGLPLTRIHNIGQDSSGFLLLTTHEGLYRYDGYNYKHYRHRQNDSSSLSSNELQRIFIDREGIIWLVTNGIERFNPFTETFRKFPLQGVE